MSDLVDHDEIERIVGAQRHDTVHLARAVSAEETVYILHSRECLQLHLAGARDLRACPYSDALDGGIDLEEWEDHQDVAIAVAVEVEDEDAWLVPLPAKLSEGTS